MDPDAFTSKLYLPEISRALLDWLKNRPEVSTVITTDLSVAGYFPLLAQTLGLIPQRLRIDVLKCADPAQYDSMQMRYPSLHDLARYHLARRVRQLTAGLWRFDAREEPHRFTTVTSGFVCALAHDSDRDLRWLSYTLSRLASSSRPSSLTVSRLGLPLSFDQKCTATMIGDELGLPIRLAIIDAVGPLPGSDGDLFLIPGGGPEAPLLIEIALAAGRPVLATRSQWTEKLLPQEALLSQSPDRAASVIDHALVHGTERRSLGWQRQDNTVASPRSRPLHSAKAKADADSIRVSVCLVTFNRAGALKQAIAALRCQTTDPFEVIVVDDGSSAPDARAYLDELTQNPPPGRWRVIRQPNAYLGSARNTAATHANGNYLLFVDDDNLARPNMVERFSLAARSSRADILTCFCDCFEHQESGEPVTTVQRVFLGNVPSIAPLHNVFGDANAMIRKAFFDSSGGFTEDYAVGHEDWEFFHRASRQGAVLEVVPEALFHYRVSEHSMLKATQLRENMFRAARPLVDGDDSGLGEFALFSQGVIVGQ
jgi:GT2 family glycosyltransferase